jgi:hypothetical protein
MTLNIAAFVRKPWLHCDVLRDDELSLGDYVE